MKNEISPLTLSSIKMAAKRLKKHLPGRKHTEHLDIASHLLVGLKSYREVLLNASSLIKKRPGGDGRTLTYGQIFYQKPAFKRGDWYFYPVNRAVVFDGEFSPYTFGIDRLGNSSELLDFLLQVQKKKWLKSQIQNTQVGPTYQVDALISLIDDLCRYYFKNSVQGVFSPSGEFKSVTWPEDMTVEEDAGGDENV